MPQPLGDSSFNRYSITHSACREHGINYGWDFNCKTVHSQYCQTRCIALFKVTCSEDRWSSKNRKWAFCYWLTRIKPRKLYIFKSGGRRHSNYTFHAPLGSALGKPEHELVTVIRRSCDVLLHSSQGAVFRRARPHLIPRQRACGAAECQRAGAARRLLPASSVPEPRGPRHCPHPRRTLKVSADVTHAFTTT